MRGRRQWGAVVASVAVVVAIAAAPATGATGGTGTQAPNGLSASEITRLRSGTSQPSIIIFRDQHRSLAAKGAASAARNATEDTDQSAVLTELGAVHATRVHAFHVVNAIGAAISQAEIAHLEQNPAVQAVVPDLPIKAPSVPAAEAGPAGSAGAPLRAKAKAAMRKASAKPAGAQPICPSDPSRPLLEPEALQLMKAAFPAGTGQTGAQDLFDGTGVKVAFMADGLDINNPDFIRTDGSHVFADYQDFTGEGVNAPTGGAEAFADAASIAAQGNQTYDLSGFVNAAYPLPPGCNIVIRGVAPGASLYGLKIFGQNNAASISSFLQAIDYAVDVDGVDIINQSFGLNPYPDTQDNPIALADEAATAAGVTVVASSGDSGSANTIASPASTPGVIGVGATTSFRLYRQTTSIATGEVPGGWLSDNISSLSSGGFTPFGPGTVDVVAPGDAGWEPCSTNVAMYRDCYSLNGQPTSFRDFAGTSESAPFTAGTAALVIQAYEETHLNVRPSPALVQRIIVSSATDLHAPAEEQGAGLVNALKAVELAESVSNGSSQPTPLGSSVLVNQPRLSFTGPAGKTHTFRVKVTNVSATAQTVQPSPQALDPASLSTQSGFDDLDADADPSFYDGVGSLSHYVAHTFSVEPGSQRLDASFTWDAVDQPNSVEGMTLFDPADSLAGFSSPEGNGSGFGEVDVHDPTPGTWTALFWTRNDGSQYAGAFRYAFTTQSFAPTGTVVPATRTLAPGATGAFKIAVRLPAQAGDEGIDLHIGTGHDDDGSIPITVRALVRLPAGSGRGGSLGGMLTGGNARAFFGVATKTFQFDVTADKPLLDVRVATADPGYVVYGFLVDPSLEPLAIHSTLGPSGSTVGSHLQFFERDPALGRWTLVLAMQAGNPGQNLEEPFAGSVRLESAPVVATGVPHRRATKLPAGTPTTATIKVTNTGTTEEIYFVDPRSSSVQQFALAPLDSTTVNLPRAAGDAAPAFLVPPDVKTLGMFATATEPIDMGMAAQFGSPEVEAPQTDTSVSAILDAPEIAPGPWSADLAPVGPFAAPPPAGTATVSAIGEGNAFDTTVTSSTGDVWAQAAGLDPSGTRLDLLPGQSGTITVTFTPNGPAGARVSGFLALDTIDVNTITGDEIANIPYTYTVS